MLHKKKVIQVKGIQATSFIAKFKQYNDFTTFCDYSKNIVAILKHF